MHIFLAAGRAGLAAGFRTAAEKIAGIKEMLAGIVAVIPYAYRGGFPGEFSQDNLLQA